jgi:hypothetical protein
MTPQCAWSGEHSDRAVPIIVPGVDRFGRRTPPRTLHVLPEHEQELRAFAERASRHGRTLLLGLLTATGAIVLVAALGTVGVLTEAETVVIAGLLVMLLGAMLMALPISTPEAIEALGVRRSRALSRGIGAFGIVVGLVMIGLR